MATAKKVGTRATRDPEGGLTAAGRAAFKARDGSRLKPGVVKPEREMTPEDMKRKGSWAVRFYGRDPLPPLVDAKGEPTRFALSAHAWGEKVPSTEAEAREIAETGRRLLERYRAAKAADKAAARTPKVATKKVVTKKAATRKTAAKKAASSGTAASKKAAAKKAGAKKVSTKKAAAA